MIVKILLCATVSLLLLLLYGTAQHTQPSTSTPNITDVILIPQGAYEQIILEHEGITDEEICRIYARNVAYWNEVDRQMCAD